MKIGCGTVLFRKFELEKALWAIRECGYEYFETQAVGPWCPHVDVEHDDPEHLVMLQKKYGFRGISGLWTKNGNIISNAASVASNIRSIEWAAAAGIPVVHTGDGSKPEGMSDREAFEILQDRLTAIVEAARFYRVKVAIEPHGAFSLTLDGLRKIMALGDEEVLGINYDACNIFRGSYVESGNGVSGWKCAEGKEDELTALKGIADRVVHCHAKDIDSNKKCVVLGKGIVNVAGCIEYLKQIGYHGVVSVETEGGTDFDQICRLAKESFEYLRRIAE